MKQINFRFKTIEDAATGISGIRAALDSHPHSDAAAFVFMSNREMSEAERLLELWDQRLPEVKRVGLSEGYAADLDPDSALVKFNLILADCGNVFYPLQIPCIHGDEPKAAAETNRFISAIPNVKGVAFYPSSRGLDVTRFLRALDSDIPFFGAMALPLYETNAMIVEQVRGEGYGIGKEVLTSGFTMLIIAGAQISINMDYILGWEPIGREMEVTLETDESQADKIGETTIRLIDGKPALEVYRKYLGVEWNENFIMNVCEFPLMVQQNGVKICLVPMDSHNGSLTLIGNVEASDKLRFSYSTREEILNEAREGSKRMAAFAPDAVIMSLCGNRINFLRQDAHLEWDYYREHNPNLVYCHGQCEIAYEKGKGGVLNSALVAVGIRECDRHTESVTPIEEAATGSEQQGYIPLGYRVSHFFHVMTDELVHLQHNLEDEVEKKTRENESLSLHVVQTLAEAIDAKDNYTSGHSGRVARYSREIARRAGYSERDQNEIYMMGLLHDVGKIGVPDAVINKPGRLTDDEFEQIKNHPVMGARILKTIREMPKLVTGARWHHERFDGRGYPDGLKGPDIPEEARIIAVADAYDAMTSNRSYRRGMEQGKVREQIAGGKGTQFDPRFADIMIQMIDEDKTYSMREL